MLAKFLMWYIQFNADETSTKLFIEIGLHFISYYHELSLVYVPLIFTRYEIALPPISPYLSSKPFVSKYTVHGLI
jgi:hypothetical protein